jgi:hypothetical protein
MHQGDEDRPSSEHQNEATEVGTNIDNDTGITGEEADSPPPPKTGSEHEQSNAYQRAYLISQYLLVGVAAAGAIIAVCTLRSLNTSVDAQGRQAQTARDQFELSERSWVGVIHIVPGKPAAQPLVNGKTVPTNLNVDVTIENFGKSPAMIGTWFDPVFWPFDAVNLSFDTQAALACGLAANDIQRQAGRLIFPNQPSLIRLRDTTSLPTKKAANGKQYVYIIGCIVYGDSVKECKATPNDYSTCRVTPFCAQSEVRVRGNQISSINFTMCPMINNNYR